MKVEEANQYAQQQWEALTLDQQMAYEQKAKMYGDPIAKEEAEDAQQQSNVSHQTIIHQDGTVSQDTVISQ
jgi:hypothetical protein